MPIETICQGCSKRLRVSDEHAGKLAKCPQCQTVYTVPKSAVATALGAGALSPGQSGGDRWHLKTDAGLTFGPVPRAELDRWLLDGRITSTAQILHEGDGAWVWAGQVYPQLGGATPPRPLNASQPFAPGGSLSPGANPFADTSRPGAYAAYPGYFAPGSYREQHRGAAILIMGIVGLVFCQFLAIAAVIMAITDLGKMKRGQMDPAGRGLTIAGLIIGSLALLLIVFQIGMVLTAAMQ